jgi:hypothetical protein
MKELFNLPQSTVAGFVSGPQPQIFVVWQQHAGGL